MTYYHSMTYLNPKTEEHEEWSYVFLCTTNRTFPEEEMDELMWNIVDMEHHEQGYRRTRFDCFHAEITRSDPTIIGQFYGVPYNAKLDMENNTQDNLSIFLLKGVYPTYSRN